jgi:hypothetical protein
MKAGLVALLHVAENGLTSARRRTQMSPWSSMRSARSRT